jgi:TPR repeat protein
MNYKSFALAALLGVVLLGCAQPEKPKAKKVVPRDINGTSSYTTSSDGTVYADQRPYYLQRCQSGSGEGCRNLSTLYELGLGVSKDMTKSLYYLEKGCSLNYGPACNRAGNFHDNVYPAVYDPEKAASYYVKGCELNNDSACNNIGSAYMNGKGVVQNLQLAETYLTKAKNLGNVSAYNNLGFLHEKRGEIEKAKTLYDKACSMNNKIACSNLAALYKETHEYTKAYNYFIKACNMASAEACNAASMMIYRKLLTVKNPDQRMFKLDSNSCEMNNATGCANVAYNYEKGIGTAPDRAKAKKFYQKSCKLGNQNSCKKVKEL